MTTWNHRVVRKIYVFNSDGDNEVYFGIHEVFYDKDGVPDGVTMDAVDVLGDTLEELQETLEWMTKALKKPVLEYSDFNGGGQYYTPDEDYGKMRSDQR